MGKRQRRDFNVRHIREIEELDPTEGGAALVKKPRGFAKIEILGKLAGFGKFDSGNRAAVVKNVFDFSDEKFIGGARRNASPSEDIAIDRGAETADFIAFFHQSSQHPASQGKRRAFLRRLHFKIVIRKGKTAIAV